MAETEQMKPVLTAEEWRLVNPQEWRVQYGITVAELPSIVAVANAALPDDDRRKITRARMTDLRLALDFAAYHSGEECFPFANELYAALDALLPPE